MLGLKNYLINPTLSSIDFYGKKFTIGNYAS